MRHHCLASAMSRISRPCRSPAAGLRILGRRPRVPAHGVPIPRHDDKSGAGRTRGPCTGRPADVALLARMSRRTTVGGLPLGIRMLKAIARVTMRALAPLVKKVESKG